MSQQKIWNVVSQQMDAEAIYTLVGLNGLTTEEVAALKLQTVDLENGWLTTSLGNTYPLVSYTITALRAYIDTVDVEQNLLFSPDQIKATFDGIGLSEAELHRRLAGALWITSDDGQTIFETVRLSETPILPLPYTFPFSITQRLQPLEESDIAVRSRSVLQVAADWLIGEAQPKKRSLRDLINILFEGKMVFLMVSTGVNGLNFVHNLLMGRLLSPVAYGELSLIITLQLLAGLIPSALQTVSARFTANYSTSNDLHQILKLRQFGGRITWSLGIILVILLVMFRGFLADVFQLSSGDLLIPVAIAIPFFISLGTDRGILQGLNRFYWLSSAYASEGVIRLVVSVALGYALLSAGRALEGTVLGLAQAMFFTWFISWIALRLLREQEETDESNVTTQPEWIRLTGAMMVALLGQALITNSDFLLVKNFFDPVNAGQYAAVTVLGRIAYFGALPLTILVVPMVAKQQALGESTRRSFIMLMSGGVGLCVFLLFMATFFAPTILELLYGEAYLPASSLLPLYTLAASLFVLTNLMVTYRVALGKGSETILPLIAGILQFIGIIVFHNTLTDVLIVQIVLMSLLLAGVGWRVLRDVIDEGQIDNLLLYITI